MFTKIDDSTVSKSVTIQISDLNAALQDLTERRDNFRSQADSLDVQIKDIQSSIDEAASLGVADAVPLSTESLKNNIQPTPPQEAIL